MSKRNYISELLSKDERILYDTADSLESIAKSLEIIANKSSNEFKYCYYEGEFVLRQYKKISKGYIIKYFNTGIGAVACMQVTDKEFEDVYEALE